MSASALYQSTPPKPDWLLPGWLLAGRVHALLGTYASGKTWTALSAACAVATGRPMMGHITPTRTAPVLYVSPAEAPTTLGQKLRSLFLEEPEGLERLHIEPGAIPLGEPHGQRQLDTWIRRTEAQMLVVDALEDCLPTDLHAARSALDALHELPCACLLLHTPLTVHADETSYLLARADMQWSLKSSPARITGEVVETTLTQKQGPRREPLYAHWTWERGLEVDWISETEADRRRASTRFGVRYLQDRVRTLLAVDYLREAGIGANESAWRRHMVAIERGNYTYPPVSMGAFQAQCKHMLEEGLLERSERWGLLVTEAGWAFLKRQLGE